MTSIFKTQHGDMTQFVQSLHTAGVTMEDVKMINKRPELAARLKTPATLPKPPAWWITPQAQLEKVRWTRLGASLNLNDFTLPPQNFVPRSETEVLMMYIQDGDLSKTFDQLWDLVETPDGYLKQRKHNLSAGSDLLCWVDGYGYEDGIHWIGFDPYTYVGLSADDALSKSGQDGLQLAGPEVLMAAFLFPSWVETWNDSPAHPFPSMSALQANFEAPPIEFWGHTPHMILRTAESERPFKKVRSLDLWTRRCEYGYRSSASPTVRVLN